MSWDDKTSGLRDTPVDAARIAGDGSAQPVERDLEAREDAAYLEPGMLFDGKYRIMRQLGRGGFGTVYLAENVAVPLDPVALKVLRRRAGEDAAYRERFLREVRTAMRLVDEHIVPVRDAGETRCGLLYYTMDYVCGRTLHDILRDEGRLDVARALLLVRGVLRGLVVTHRAGIVHRDVKPANIVIEQCGDREVPRLLDFGIATSLKQRDLKRGSFSGSPHYIAPEQFKGADVTRSSDVYSVGVILYECLTGQRPYAGKTLQEVYRSLTDGCRPSVDALCPRVREYCGLQEAVNGAIRRGPRRRYASAREFLDALEGVVHTPDPVEEPATRRSVDQQVSGSKMDEQVTTVAIQAALHALVFFLALVCGRIAGDTLAGWLAGVMKL